MSAVGSPRSAGSAGAPIDVAVVGGGIIGLASAWRLARCGLDVTVFDPEPGSGASSVAAGMLAPVTEASMGEEELLALGLASLSRWEGFAAELTAATGRPLGLRSQGTLMVAVDGDDRAALADLVDRQRQMGLTVDPLTSRELHREEPALAPAVRKGIRATDERSVDPVAVVDALVVAVEQAGGRICRERVAELTTSGSGFSGAGTGGGDRGDHSSVRGPARSPGQPGPGHRATGHRTREGAAPDGRVTGVRLADGKTVAAGMVVLAAGPWAPQVGSADLGPLAVRPVKGQVLTLRQRPDDILVQHTVRGFVRGEVIYLVPRDDGRLVCGATVEERGWDRIPTAGGGYQLLRDVLTLYPGLDEAELVELKVGFRPGTPDHLPLLGPASRDGLVLATGHYRNGILLAPVTAEAVEAFVTGAEPPPEVAPCAPERFVASP